MAVAGALEQQNTTDAWPWSNDPAPAAPSYDPNNPDTWTGDQRVAFLSDLGLTHVSGQGGAAIWALPDGRRVTEPAAFDMALGTYKESIQGGQKVIVPDQAPVPIGVPTKASGAPDSRYLPDGTYQEWDGSKWVTDAAAFNPTKAVGYRAPAAVDTGPTAYQNSTLAEDQRQFDATQARMLADMEMRRQQAESDLALQMKLYDFNVSKEQYAQATGNRRLELDTQAQMFGQEVTIQNLIASRDQANAQIDQFNARMAFDAQQLDVQREENRQTRLQTLNRDTAAMAADPGDRAAYASFGALNSGWGQQDAGLAEGADFRTDESLQPLQSNLNLREILGKPLAPTVAPQTARLGPLDLSALRAKQTQMPQFLPQPKPVIPVLPTAQTNLASGVVPTALNSSKFEDRPTTPEETAVWEKAIGLPEWVQNFGKAEHGGVMEGAYISGERGPEINIPTPEGAIVLNQKQAKKLGIDLKALLSNPEVKKMATGGIFTGSTAPENAGARSFLDTSVAKARAGTPFASGVLPTPVYASSPGFNPVIAKLLASINAQARGLPAEEFYRQAGLLAPNAMSERVVSRSA